MKPKPIIFQTESVKAIFEGRKTMTRRIINPQPVLTDHPRSLQLKGWNGAFWPGDILWVRETFCQVTPEDEVPFYPKYVFKTGDVDADCNYKWKPSIYMPKEACRLFLKVINVKVERVQEISGGADCVSEGIDVGDGHGCYNYLKKEYGTFDTIESYKTLWIKINGEESWQQNLWVWVIEFEKIEIQNL